MLLDVLGREFTARHNGVASLPPTGGGDSDDSRACSQADLQLCRAHQSI